MPLSIYLLLFKVPQKSVYTINSKQHLLKLVPKIADATTTSMTVVVVTIMTVAVTMTVVVIAAVAVTTVAAILEMELQTRMMKNA